MNKKKQLGGEVGSLFKAVRKAQLKKHEQKHAKTREII